MTFVVYRKKPGSGSFSENYLAICKRNLAAHRQLNSINRRNFLKTAGAAIILPTILPSSVLGRGGKAPPSGKITMGVVGWGSQGPGDAAIFARRRTTATWSPRATLTRTVCGMR